MASLRGVRARWILPCAIALLLGPAALTLGNPSTKDQTPAHLTATIKDTNEARWKNGELLAPLSVDPIKRAEAIRQAKQLTASRRESRNAGSLIRPTRIQAESGKVVVGREKGPGWQGTFRRPTKPFVLPELNYPEGPSPSRAPGLEDPRGQVMMLDRGPHGSSAAGTLFSFDAIDDTGWTPASPDIAAGSDHVVVVTSDVFAVYDKCGNWLDGGLFRDYFSLSTDFLYYDPRVVYDGWDDRWVMVYTALDLTNDVSMIFIAASLTSDPTDGWYLTAFTTPPLGNFADNMYLAVDPEAVYVTHNAFDFTTYSFNGAVILIVDRTALYASTPPGGVYWSGLTNPGDATLASAIRPAQMNTYPGEMYLLNNKHTGGNIYTLWAASGGITSPILSSSNVSSAWYSTAPPMRQPNGTYVKPGDCRFTDVVYGSGVLYGAFTRFYSGDLAAIQFEMIDVASSSVSNTASFAAANSFLSYAALDIDEYGRVAFCWSICGPAKYLTAHYAVLNPDPLFGYAEADLAPGLADYTAGGSGTPADPYRWGHYFGCARDPVDDRTMWIVGTYASDDPIPSWTTRVGAVTSMPLGELEVSPTDELTSGGFSGGPFTTNSFTYTLSNAGGTNVNWSVSGVPSWLSPAGMNGQLAPGASQDVTFLLNANAYTLPVGIYAADLVFDNCTGTGGGNRAVTLGIVEPNQCAGAVVDMNPNVGMTYYSGPGEFGAFVTALEDIDVCGIALNVMIAQPEFVTARVYEADGTTRGALLAGEAQFLVEPIYGHFFVPVDIMLSACQDYEIAVEINGATSWGNVDETEFSYPFDVGGVIRVREGSESGSAAGIYLPFVALLATSPCDLGTGRTTDLLPDGPIELGSSMDSEQGIYVTALENMRLCSVGFEADLVLGTKLMAQVYDATGTTRGAPIAFGTTTVTTGGVALHEIPIHTHLYYGEEYDVAVRFQEAGWWEFVDESNVSLPDTADGVIVVRQAEMGGGALNDEIPHLWLNWDGVAGGGVPFDLAKSSDGIPAPYSTAVPLDHGAYVTAHADWRLFGLGVMADIPEGEVVGARVYAALGVMRGGLISEGEIRSSGGGMRWHDVPVAMELQSGKHYDLSIVCGDVNEFVYWNDLAGMPYTPYGAIDVRDGEAAGSASASILIHMRVHGCDEVLTGVEDEPSRFMPMALEPPSPNPATGVVTFRYSLDAPAQADLAIYDVLGRWVAQVFTDRHTESGFGSTQFDTSRLISGVYFLKLRTKTEAVSRKFVVAH